jgi:hypothetical protein
MKNQRVRQLFPRKRQAKRYRHLERLSLTAVQIASRYSGQMSKVSSMVSALARDDLVAQDRKALLGGLEELTQGYASDARMDMEHLEIAQMRYTAEWKRYKKSLS